MFGLRTKRETDAGPDAPEQSREAVKRICAVVDAYDHLLDRTSPTLNCISLLPASKQQLKTYLMQARNLDKKGRNHQALQEAYMALATFQQLTQEQADAAGHCDFLDELRANSWRDAGFKSPDLKAKLVRYSEAMELLAPALDKVARESHRLAAEWTAFQV
jgi:hypothetical protein